MGTTPNTSIPIYNTHRIQHRISFYPEILTRLHYSIIHQLLFTATNTTLPSDDNTITQEQPSAPETTEHSPATLETIVEETEEDLQESDYAVSVYDPKDEQLAQAGKRAKYYLQLEAETQPIERLSSEDRFRPDRLVYPEMPIYDIQLAPQHYHLLWGNRSEKKD